MRRTLVLLAFVAGALWAQDSKPAPPKLPSPLRQALARIGKGEAPPVELRGPVSANPHKCSVPLLQADVKNPEWFTIRQLKPATQSDVMPRAVVPAPPCETQ